MFFSPSARRNVLRLLRNEVAKEGKRRMEELLFFSNKRPTFPARGSISFASYRDSASTDLLFQRTRSYRVAYDASLLRNFRPVPIDRPMHRENSNLGACSANYFPNSFVPPRLVSSPGRGEYRRDERTLEFRGVDGGGTARPVSARNPIQTRCLSHVRHVRLATRHADSLSSRANVPIFVS